LVAAFIVFAAIGAGCGGGGGTKTVTQVQTQSAAPPLTKDQYIAQADAICAKGRPERDCIKSEIQDAAASGSTDASRIADLENQAADYVNRLLSQLQPLPKPSGDDQVLGELYSLVNAQASDFQHLADATSSLDAAQIRSIAETTKSDEERARGVATGYGFKVCGQS